MVQLPHVASYCNVAQCKDNTPPSLQKALLDYIIISWCRHLHKSTLNKCVYQSLLNWHFFFPSWVRDMVIVGLLQMCVGVSDLVWVRGKSHSYWLLWLLSPYLPWGNLAMMVSRGDLMGLFPNDSGVKEKTRCYQRPVLTLHHGIILNWKHKWKLHYILGGQGVCKFSERRRK